MLQARYDLNCVLKDVESGKAVLEFEARQVGDYTEHGGFVGSGIGSSGHSFSVATAKMFDYTPQNYKVFIKELGLEFLIMSRRPVRYKRIGELFSVEDATEIVLELE